MIQLVGNNCDGLKAALSPKPERIILSAGEINDQSNNSISP